MLPQVRLVWTKNRFNKGNHKFFKSFLCEMLRGDVPLAAQAQGAAGGISPRLAVCAQRQGGNFL